MMRALLRSLVVCAVFPSVAQASFLSAGYHLGGVPASEEGEFVGGLAVLPGGNYAVFDGTAIVERSRADGSVVRTLFTPPTQPSFGSFLAVHPAGTHLYFGESSFGDVWQVDLTTLSGMVVTNAVFPYDLAFDHLGRAFLSWSPGFGLGSKVSQVDLASGALDTVLTSTEASGPLAFDAAGNLYYARPDSSAWPPPLDGAQLRRFSAAAVQGALGPAELLDTDGALLAQLDGAFDMEIDEEGDVLVSDSVYDKLVEVDVTTGAEVVRFDGQGPLFEGITYVGYGGGGPGAFEAYQPDGAGELVMVRTDFITYNRAWQLHPRRPRLSLGRDDEPRRGRFARRTPARAAALRLTLEHAVPGGYVLLLVGSGLRVTEQELPNGTAPAPLLLGLTGSLQLLPMEADVSGELTLEVDHPGLIGAQLAVQAVVGDTPSGPYFGTSNAVLLDG